MAASASIACAEDSSRTGNPTDHVRSPVPDIPKEVSPSSSLERAGEQAHGLPSRFDGQRALAHVQVLAGEIGPRVAGTEEERSAANYIAGQLAKAGYEVEQTTFSFRAFVDFGTSLVVLAPESKSIEATPLQSTAAGKVTAEVVAAGIGRPADFPDDGAGKIALIERGDIFFSEKVENAAKAGAPAAIIYNSIPGRFAGRLDTVPSIPAVTITRAQGLSLLDLMEETNVIVQLDTRVSHNGASQNIVAKPPHGECRMYVGAHYDSVAAAEGGNDNASGTATVIEIARSMAADGEFDDACFALFGAEEIGLFGSRAVAQSFDNRQRESTIAMLNFDVVGAGTRFLVGGSPAIAELAVRKAEEEGVALFVGNLPSNASSDHASFIEIGIPAIFFYRSGGPPIHTPADTASVVEADLLEETGKVGLATIMDLLSDTRRYYRSQN